MSLTHPIKMVLLIRGSIENYPVNISGLIIRIIFKTMLILCTKVCKCLVIQQTFLHCHFVDHTPNPIERGGESSMIIIDYTLNQDIEKVLYEGCPVHMLYILPYWTSPTPLVFRRPNSPDTSHLWTSHIGIFRSINLQENKYFSNKTTSSGDFDDIHRVVLDDISDNMASLV